MSLRRIDKWLGLLCMIACLGACLMISKIAMAAEYHGQVTFGGLPVPGATVTATQGSQKFVAVSDQQGIYSFADLPDGAWTILVEMQCFSRIEQTITIAPNMQTARWELKLLSFDEIMSDAKAVKTEPKPVLSTSIDAAP